MIYAAGLTIAHLIWGQGLDNSLQKMTLEEKVGQLFIVCFKGEEANQTSKTMSLSDQMRLLQSIQKDLAEIEKTYLLDPKNQETKIFRATFLRQINR